MVRGRQTDQAGRPCCAERVTGASQMGGHCVLAEMLSAVARAAGGGLWGALGLWASSPEAAVSEEAERVVFGLALPVVWRALALVEAPKPPLAAAQSVG